MTVFDMQPLPLKELVRRKQLSGYTIDEIVQTTPASSQADIFRAASELGGLAGGGWGMGYELGASRQYLGEGPKSLAELISGGIVPSMPNEGPMAAISNSGCPSGQTLTQAGSMSAHCTLSSCPPGKVWQQGNNRYGPGECVPPPAQYQRGWWEYMQHSGKDKYVYLMAGGALLSILLLRKLLKGRE